MRHQAAHLLRSEILQLEVMDPVDPERYNRGVRFSPVANVLRATMGGKDFLFSPVEHDPLKENCGLAMEFDIGTVGEPRGFTETAMGEGFLKIGVGVLRKNIERYSFFAAYEVIELARTTVKWSESAAHFEQSCAGVNDYAYKLATDIFVKGNILEIHYALANTGQKPFVTEQYTHNYFSFAGAPTGPNYILRFPFDFEATGLHPEQERKGREIDFARPISPKIAAVNAVVTPPVDHQGEHSVEVLNPANGMSILASNTLPSLRIAVHATPRYLCPEQFILISLQPGESRQWVRRFEFNLRK